MIYNSKPNCVRSRSGSVIGVLLLTATTGGCSSPDRPPLPPPTTHTPSETTTKQPTNYLHQTSINSAGSMTQPNAVAGPSYAGQSSAQSVSSAMATTMAGINGLSTLAAYLPPDPGAYNLVV